MGKAAKVTGLPESFLSRLKLTESGCLEWRGARDTERGGYGHLRVRGRTFKAHRWAWFLAHGAHAIGMVLHRCDNPPCCNPDHLFVGTAADNARDMAAKGRSEPHRGEANGNALLTVGDVVEIRARYAAGVSQRALAREFGVSRGAVENVVRRKNWAHVA